MKKLIMFAAAMTIVGGAYATCADPVIVSNNCALVYDVKFTVKTTLPKGLSGSANTSECGDNSTEAVCYRTPGSVSLKGYLETCDCNCEGLQDAELTLWSPKYKSYVQNSGFGWTFLNVIGKKNTETEGFWTLAIDGGVFYGAGFGSWNKDNARVTSMSGNFAGFMAAPECENDVSCDAAIAYPCADLSVPAELPTAAFGTWSIKYNKSLSKKVAAGEALPIPNYVTEVN